MYFYIAKDKNGTRIFGNRPVWDKHSHVWVARHSSDPVMTIGDNDVGITLTEGRIEEVAIIKQFDLEEMNRKMHGKTLEDDVDEIARRVLKPLQNTPDSSFF